MSSTEKCTRSMYLYGFSRILLTIHRRFFEDRKSDQGIAKEKQEVCLDKGMSRIISKA
jgi:hypothetical protein